MFCPDSPKKKHISTKSRYTESAPNEAKWKPRKASGRRLAPWNNLPRDLKTFYSKILRGEEKQLQNLS